VASSNDVRAEIRQFLTTRRAKLTPGQAGLPAHGRNRRVDTMTGTAAFLCNGRLDILSANQLGSARPRRRGQPARRGRPRAPYDRALTDLVGELSVRSQEFLVRWAAHDVDYYRSGVQPFHHPLVGDLTLD